jgi:hypothetical protein
MKKHQNMFFLNIGQGSEINKKKLKLKNWTEQTFFCYSIFIYIFTQNYN